MEVQIKIVRFILHGGFVSVSWNRVTDRAVIT